MGPRRIWTFGTGKTGGGTAKAAWKRAQGTTPEKRTFETKRVQGLAEHTDHTNNCKKKKIKQLEDMEH